jgi:hypothetical protein
VVEEKRHELEQDIVVQEPHRRCGTPCLLGHAMKLTGLLQYLPPSSSSSSSSLPPQDHGLSCIPLAIKLLGCRWTFATALKDGQSFEASVTVKIMIVSSGFSLLSDSLCFTLLSCSLLLTGSGILVQSRHATRTRPRISHQDSVKSSSSPFIILEYNS